jgi:hypothetical protein
MKKISICALVLLTSLSVLGQNKKGNIIIGTSLGSGSVGHSNGESGNSVSSNINKSKSTSFGISLNPSVGKFLTDNIVLGIEPGIGFSSSKTIGSNTTTSNTSTSKSSYFYASIGAYGRFYLGKASTKGMPFVQAGTGITFYPGYDNEVTYSTGIGNYNVKYESYTPWFVYGRAGYEHFINTIIGLQFYIGYSHSDSQYDYTVDYDSGGGDYTGYSESNGGNFQFGAGLLIHLTCDKKKK